MENQMEKQVDDKIVTRPTDKFIGMECRRLVN